jgi:hypothetical protein
LPDKAFFAAKTQKRERAELSVDLLYVIVVRQLWVSKPLAVLIHQEVIQFSFSNNIVSRLMC